MEGGGGLKTNFDALATQIITLEQHYTLGANLKKMLSLLGVDRRLLVAHCEQQTPGTQTTVDSGFVETNSVQVIKAFESNELKGRIQVTVDMPGTSFGPQGAVNGTQVKILLPVSLVVQFKDLLLE